MKFTTPCPRCGRIGQQEVLPYTWGVYVSCPCSAFFSGEFKSDKSAIEAWNSHVVEVASGHWRDDDNPQAEMTFGVRRQVERSTRHNLTVDVLMGLCTRLRP